MTTITDPAELAPTCSQCGDALGDIAAECVDCSALLCSANCEDTHACLPQSAPPQTGSQGPLDGCAHAAADSTGRHPRAAWAAENARLRSQLAEAREQRDQAAEALVRAETERDEALCAITKIAEMLGFPGGDLREAIRALRRERDDALQEAESVGRQLHSSTREVDRLIAQLATVTQERDRWQQLADERAQNLHATLRRAFAAEDVALAARREVEALRIERDEARAAISRLALAVAGLADDTMARAQQAAAGEPPDAAEELAAVARRMLTLLPDEPPAATAPETASTAPQTGEQTGVRVETGTETASARVDLVIGLRQRGVPQHPDGPEAAALAEIDRLRAEIDRLERAAHEQGADLWIAEDRMDWLRKRVRLAMDLLCSPTVPHEKGPDVPGAYGILSHALAATAPETGLSATETDEQAQVRSDSSTEASAGADGPWSDAWCRTQLQRLSIAASEQYGLRWRDYDIVGAVIEELATLHARNREWEQTLGDLAARCDSGDIPIRLGERYSVAVLREIDRLRTALNSQGGSR